MPSSDEDVAPETDHTEPHERAPVEPDLRRSGKMVPPTAHQLRLVAAWRLRAVEKLRARIRTPRR